MVTERVRTVVMERGTAGDRAEATAAAVATQGGSPEVAGGGSLESVLLHSGEGALWLLVS